MAYDVKALGRWIRHQRESWGLTQHALATKTGLNQKKISRLEQGEIADPGFADVAAITMWFGVSMTHVAVIADLIDRNDIVTRSEPVVKFRGT